MYAIVTIAGQQVKAEAGKEVIVHRLKGNVGDKLSFSDALMRIDGDQLNVGGTISATILDHFKGEKLIAFKKKRRKGYKKKHGHRTFLTKLKIDSVE
jgi:large subunit ribosomal protein L21